MISMTRQVLARFERDDTQEAQVICRTGDRAGVDNPGSYNIQPEKLSGSTKDGVGSIEDHPSRSWAWRLPGWMTFSYSTVPRRLRLPEQRQPDPFGPRARSFSRIRSVDEIKPTAPTQGQPSEASPLHSPSPEKPCPPACILTSLVQRHPPLAAWDDEPRHDIPYDNPYYTKPITNALWLPRNPLGLLDLDDTVDVYRALTSEPGVGDVGHWFWPDSSTTPVFQLPSSVPSEEQPSAVASRQYSGREDIDLSEGIKSRVNAIDREGNIESTRARRPSLFSRNRAGSGGSMMSSSVRASRGLLPRSQTMDGGHPEFTRKSSSDGVTRSSSERAPQCLPPLNLDSQSQFRGVDPGSRPDLHAQAEFARSTGSIMHGGSRASLPHPASVTTREAIVTEAIAEERLATEERLRKEEADAKTNNGSTRWSWLTSWIYAKIQ